MKKITIISSGSFGPCKKIIRDEVSWIRSAKVESELFDFNTEEIFAAACGSGHSLYKYAKFRSKLINAPFVEASSLNKRKDKSFCSKNFIRSLRNNCPSIIYSLPNILRIICLLLKKNNSEAKFEKVKLILSGGEAWISDLELLVNNFFPNAKIVEFYGAAELGFVGWGNPGRGYNLFPNVKAWCDNSNKIWVESPYLANVDSPATVGDTGWFDKKGLLHLTGRSDRNFRIKGETVAPEKIEKVLVTHLHISNAYVFKKKNTSRISKIAVIICISTDQENSKNMTLKLSPLSDSKKNIIKSILLKKNIHLSTTSIKIINSWPLLVSGKTNFRLLESLW